MNLSTNILDTLKRLCSIKSTSGTEEEASAATAIYEIIGEIGYFKEHKGNLILHEMDKDPFGRKYITALFEGSKSQKTVVLLSHFDTVGIDDYASINDCAYDPVRYTEMLNEGNLTGKAALDLASGDWLFGRGTMDMKCGLAIHIEIMKYLYDNAAGFEGNILLLTVPDEENSSAGMLSAVNYLSYIQDMGYELSGVINTEPSFEEFPGDENNYIYTGTVGKALPLIVFAGVETHGGQPFSGISSTLLSSITTSIIEANTEFCETFGSFSTPPPVCLKQRDLKDMYSVSVPSLSYA